MSSSSVDDGGGATAQSTLSVDARSQTNSADFSSTALSVRTSPHSNHGPGTFALRKRTSSRVQGARLRALTTKTVTPAGGEAQSIGSGAALAFDDKAKYATRLYDAADVFARTDLPTEIIR